MTGAIDMIEFTPDAQIRLANYLQQVRSALAGSSDINPDEIEADIREHVENELHDAPQPVNWTALDAVLTRLGPPSQWGAGGGDLSLFKRTGIALRERLRGAKTSLGDQLRSIRATIWRGPEDWRLAYLTFGVFATGVLVFPFFPLFLVLAYILGRAGIGLARQKGVELGTARKWLLYPPVAIVSLALLITILAVPVVAGGVTAAEVAGALQRVKSFEGSNPDSIDARDWRSVRDREARQAMKERMASQLEEDRELLAMVPVQREWAPAVAGLFVGVGACAPWGVLLGVLGGMFPHAVRAVFLPLAERFRSSLGWWLAVPSVAMLALWCMAAYEVAASAGGLR